MNIIINKDLKLWDLWVKNASFNPNGEVIVHFNSESGSTRITWKKLIEEANYIASKLLSKGIKKNDVCGIILKHVPEFYSIYLAIVQIGALPAVLTYPNPRLHPSKFQEGLMGMSKRSGLDWIITEEETVNMISPIIMGDHSTIRGYFLYKDLISNKIHQNDLLVNGFNEVINIQDPVLLQHSSGTTGLQKPVVLSNSTVYRHLKRLEQELKITQSDKIVSWLPLYHDMGLIGAFHLALACGVTLIQIDPFDWVTEPSILLKVISEENATVCWLPNFAYNLMSSKVKKKELQNISLKSLRLLVNCSEPIRIESHELFYESFKEFQLNKSVFACSYAMAETTLVVSLTSIGKEPNTICLDKNALAKNLFKISDNSTHSKIYVSSGKIMNGSEVRIIDDYSVDLGHESIGEVIIKSDTMFDGYRNYPEKTKEVLIDGWYHSGDIGFIYDDELYIIGRKKDIIIHAGNNVYPEDIEDVVNKVNEVIAGRVVVFGEEDNSLGTEMISVVVESVIDSIVGKKNIKLDIKKEVAKSDITIQNVYIVPPRWLIKSSSGKLSRKANKERILKEKIWKI